MVAKPINNKLQQVFIHYLQWECFKFGMYARPGNSQAELIQKSIELFKDGPRLKVAMERVITEWPNSTLHNFTNGGLNRRSWLGQAACCIDHQIPEIINRDAWNGLTDVEMKKANNIADELIKNWETSQRNEEIFRNQCIRGRAVQGVLDLR